MYNIYTLPDCCKCHDVMEKLDEKGISYTEYNAKVKEGVAQLRKEVIKEHRNELRKADYGGYEMPIIYFDGKEFLRKSRNINFYEFEKDLSRLYSMFFED